MSRSLCSGKTSRVSIQIVVMAITVTKCGIFETDSEVPFINQVTTIQMDKNGNFTQYLMSGEYPVIPSTGSNPGNPLLFGAGAYFMPNNITQYANGVISLDAIRQPTVIGY